MGGLVATSQAQAAATIGIGARTFANWLVEGCPYEHRHYDIAEIIAWARVNKWSGEEVELLDGPSTESLEKLRNEQYLIKRLERLQLEGKLVDQTEIERMYLRAMGHIRNAGDSLQKRFGPEALDILDEAIREALQTIGRDGDDTRDDQAK